MSTTGNNTKTGTRSTKTIPREQMYNDAIPDSYLGEYGGLKVNCSVCKVCGIRWESFDSPGVEDLCDYRTGYGCIGYLTQVINQLEKLGKIKKALVYDQDVFYIPCKNKYALGPNIVLIKRIIYNTSTCYTT